MDDAKKESIRIVKAVQKVLDQEKLKHQLAASNNESKISKSNSGLNGI